MSYFEKTALSKVINDLLESKIIRPSSSPYCSPVVFIKKKNRDEYRLCVDYRILNKNTFRDNYPLPGIEDLVDRLENKKYFSL